MKLLHTALPVPLFLVSPFLVSLLLIASAPIRAGGETAVEADKFVDSVGIVVHLSYTDTVYYQDFPLIESSLAKLGIRHVRDGIMPGVRAYYYERHNQLTTDLGIHGLFATRIGLGPSDISAFVKSMGAPVEALEAPNEYDRANDPQWAATLRAYMPVLYAAKGKYPIVGPSVGGQPSSFAAMGDLSAYEDYGNLHNYPASRPPGTPGFYGFGSKAYASIPWALGMSAINAPGKPVWTTEDGYNNNSNVKYTVPESVSATYMPRLLLMQWTNGIQRTYIYELATEHALTAKQEDFGLLRYDGSRKPAFGAVANLLNLLKDPGPEFRTGSLDYSIEGGDATLRHILFQKRDGTYYLALWLETTTYDQDAQTPIQVAPQPVSVSLMRAARGITAYQLDSTGAMTESALPAGRRILLNAGPNVLVIKLVMSAR